MSRCVDIEISVWAMSYYGYILRPDRIDAARAGATIRGALQAMYGEGRFLGGFDWSGPHGRLPRPFDGRRIHVADVDKSG